MRIRTDPGYEVTADGHIRNLLTGRTLTPFPRGASPHLSVDLPSGRRYVHQLVAEHYIGPCPTGEEVRHLDNDATNNAVSNLEYGTRSQNVLDLRARRTHCPQGHEYTTRNSYFDPNGWRSCRTCRNASRRRYRHNADSQHQA